IPAALPEEARERLAELLGVPQEELRGTGPASRSSRPAYLRLPPSPPGDRIPVMGVAEGGGEGRSLWNGEIVDYVPRPPVLSGAPVRHPGQGSRLHAPHHRQRRVTAARWISPPACGGSGAKRRRGPGPRRRQIPRMEYTIGHFFAGAK